jgi:para-nitrobenzyl esterase
MSSRTGSTGQQVGPRTRLSAPPRWCVAVMVSVLAATAAPAASAASGATAHVCASSIRDGRIAGATEAGMCAFEGIPYAAPPIGKLRFRPPASGAGGLSAGPRSAGGVPEREEALQ